MLVIFLFSLQFIFVLYAKYDCNTNKAVILQYNEIAFFETTDFPTLLSNESFYECILEFALENNIAAKEHKLYAAYMEILEAEYNFTYEYKTVFQISKNSIFSLQTSFPSLFMAQQGFIYFDDSDGCPLESICNPFKFSDETEIVNIRSSFFENSMRTKNCKWNFIAPENYGFKVVVEIFDVSLTTQLIISNSTVVLVNKRSLITYYPYYNGDNYLHIFLSNGDPNFKTSLEFQAYVSVVKKDVEKIDANCSIVTTNYENEQTIWSNNEYINNAHCNYDFKIMNNTAIQVTVRQLWLEKYVDYIKFDNNVNVLDFPFDTFMLEPYRDHSDRIVSFEFYSDGSVFPYKFEIEFKKIICECTKPMIPCRDEEHTMITNSSVYCNNMKCSFYLQPCSSNLTELTIYTGAFGELNDDVVKIFSNETNVLEINNYHQNLGAFVVYLNSLDNNTISVETFPSVAVRQLIFKAKTFKKPLVDLKIKMSTDVPCYILDTGLTKFTVFEIFNKKAPENITFIIYSYSPGGIYLYTDESLSVVLTNKHCFGELDWYTCRFNSNRFAAFWNTNSVVPILAITVPEFSRGCVFRENVHISRNASNVVIVGLANTQGDCVLQILIDPFANELGFYDISYIYTTAKKQNVVKMFVGTFESKMLLEFNSESAKKWADIKLYTNAYHVIVPKGSVLMIKLKRVLRIFEQINITSFPYQSLYFSPYFCASKMYYQTFPKAFTTYNIGNYSTIFTTIYYNLFPGDKMRFKVNNRNIFINKTGDTLTFKNQVVQLYYTYAQSTETRNGVAFSIKTLNETGIDYFG